MKVRAFFVCEQVIVRANQTIDVLNFGIRRLHLRVNKPNAKGKARIYILCSLEFTSADESEQRLKIYLMEPDGPRIGEKTFDIKMEGKSKTTEINLHGPITIEAKKSGSYAVIANLSGLEISRWPLEIVLSHPTLQES